MYGAELTIKHARTTLDGFAPAAERIIIELGDDFPDYYDPHAGTWARNGGWTEGFWTGILWQLYAHTRDPHWWKWARRYTRLLAESKRDFTDHDLGFLYDHSCVMEHALTGDEEMLPEALVAADRLARRFNPAGRFIRAHGMLDDPHRAGYAIVDTAMNLHLLFWAHERTGNDTFRRVAVEVAHTILREYVRPDASTYQVVWFDPISGAVERKETLQGHAPDSCWSRGQAWAIYGFAEVYRFTGEEVFCDTAGRLADYFLTHLPADGVAPYDFLDPAIPDVPTDTSAQAIAAAGLFALAALRTGKERRRRIADGVRLLIPLLNNYLAPLYPDPMRSRGFLRGGCYFLARQRGVDSELMFGDYYLVEALMRYLSLMAWE